MKLSAAPVYIKDLIFVSLCLILSSLSIAQSSPCHDGTKNHDEDADHFLTTDCVKVNQWHLGLALGVGSVTNPVDSGRDVPLLLVPKVSYYGHKFFLNNLDLGYTLFEDVKQALSLISSPGYDQVFFHRNSKPEFINRSSNEINNFVTSSERQRKFTYLSGVDWTYALSGVDMQVSYLHEITGRHHGKELRLAAALPLTALDQHLSASVGATWKSKRLVNYYYGEPDLYNADDALNPFVKLSYKTQINRNWNVKIFGQYEWLDRAIKDSPIVNNNEIVSIFIGGEYNF